MPLCSRWQLEQASSPVATAGSGGTSAAAGSAAPAAPAGTGAGPAPRATATRSRASVAVARPCAFSGCVPMSWQARQGLAAAAGFWSPTAAWTQAIGPAAKPVWQVAQSWMPACCAVRWPGSTSHLAAWSLPSMIASRPSTVATARRAIWPRRARWLRTGTQGGIGQAQVPSARGPSTHLPPAEGGRVHSQRSPLRCGRHSNVAWQWPCRSGPMRQGWPSATRPQIHG